MSNDPDVITAAELAARCGFSAVTARKLVANQELPGLNTNPTGVGGGRLLLYAPACLAALAGESFSLPHDSTLDGEVITSAELAARWRISTQTIRKLVTNGQIPALKTTAQGANAGKLLFYYPACLAVLVGHPYILTGDNLGGGEVITSAELADRWQIQEQTVRNLADKGHIPGFKAGPGRGNEGKWLFYYPACVAVLANVPFPAPESLPADHKVVSLEELAARWGIEETLVIKMVRRKQLPVLKAIPLKDELKLMFDYRECLAVLVSPTSPQLYAADGPVAAPG